MNNTQTLIAALEGAPDIIIGLVREVPSQNLKRRPSPNKWSAHEHACHISSADTAYLSRLKLMLSESDEKRIRQLTRDNQQMTAIAELRAATGCPLSWAKIWVYHEGRPKPLEHDTLPCPYCGKALRTSLAKQCRYCRRDWHDSTNVVVLGSG